MGIMKLNSEGNKLTQEILRNLGFKKEVSQDSDNDESKWWYGHGISIHEESWWLQELDEDGEHLDEPISSYSKGEKTPEIQFSFATYVRGDGGFKGGYSVMTDQQLINIVYALSNVMIFTCDVCEKNPVDGLGGYHTCPDCTALTKESNG